MRMLSFYYDVVDRFVDRRDYCVLEMDTDSLYLAVSGMDLDSVVKPEMTQEWEEAKKEWFPRIDSKSNAAYDLRTPGLFKMEWEGDGFVGLAAKTYYCFHNNSPDKDKHSAKGINRNFRLSKEDYLKVLNKDPKQELQVNKGFIVKGQSMYTYELTKKGLDHLYVKRKVLDNGISTTYLDI
ncbi:uncharacterized protein LOC134823531 [Bolinopsis microptera]|uniref:uncharacterized protein LOC134823531 n=1 Tax=Bolinopsis microptera TaxID=2820187 RepID=UPI003078DD8C